MAGSDDALTVQNAYLTKMLVQAGLDAEAQVVAARIQNVLTNEIHHRMKNMLAMVTAVVRQSMRSATSMADAEAAISTRLIAMARAHDLLLKAELQSADLREVIHGAVDQHDTLDGRITIEGEHLLVVPSSILPLTLILNELCTNATKYGAFSDQNGRVQLSWMLNAENSVVLKWLEMDGPPVATPSRKSFGTRLLAEALPQQLGGTARLTYLLSGVEFQLVVPYDMLKPVAVP